MPSKFESPMTSNFDPHLNLSDTQLGKIGLGGLARKAKLVKSMNKIGTRARKIRNRLKEFKSSDKLDENDPANPILGPIKFQRGETYEGQINQELLTREGNGTQVWRDGSVYEGQWKFDQRHGEGRHIFLNGDYYEGEWVRDKEEGKGVHVSYDGTKYIGEFSHGSKWGQGIQIYPDGKVYKGEFKDGQKSGRGEFKWPDGGRYEGEFRKNKIEGYGKRGG